MNKAYFFSFLFTDCIALNGNLSWSKERYYMVIWLTGVLIFVIDLWTQCNFYRFSFPMMSNRWLEEEVKTSHDWKG